MTQDRPDAAELLESVAEYLFAELRPEVPSGQRFRVLVAANVCAVVARELRAEAWNAYTCADPDETLELLERFYGKTDAGRAGEHETEL